MNGSDDEAKALEGKVHGDIGKASLFVRKVVVTGSVELSIEKALVKSAAIYPFIESLNKSLIIQAGQTASLRRMCLEQNQFVD